MNKVLLSIFITISLFSNSLASTVINVSFEDKQTYPYYTGEGKSIDSTYPGLAIEAIKSIENKLNTKFTFQREPSQRGQKKLQYNKIDMLLFLSYNESRKKIGVYPTNEDGSIDKEKRSMNLSYNLYVLKESSLDWDGKKFINLNGKIGATKGYSIVKFLEDRGVDISENDNNLGDSAKLIAKRIVGFANQEVKIDYYLKQNPNIAKKIRKIKTPLKSKEYYILFSKEFYKNNTKLSNEIWNELKQINTSSKFKIIRSKY